jgi:hypothetical protein
LNKGLCMLAVAMIGAALVAPANSQTASSSAASAQGDTVGLRVAAFIVPPFVMEQHGSLTGFSIELWDAIAMQGITHADRRSAEAVSRQAIAGNRPTPLPFARRRKPNRKDVDQKGKGLFLSGLAPRLVDGNILYRLARGRKNDFSPSFGRALTC